MRVKGFWIWPVLHCAMFCGICAADRAVVVAADGSGDFKTVQAAVDAADTKVEPLLIRIQPGTYRELIKVSKARITFRGEGSDPTKTVLTYDLTASTKIAPATQPVGTSGSASTLITASDFTAENLTFENAAGDVGQAVAVKITGDRGVYRNCRFIGWQDTLYPDDGRQYFESCYIEGRTDFIFGGATAVFDHCTVHSKNGGFVTAARTLPTKPFGYVFLDCTLTGDGAPAFLGRPWQWDRGRHAAVSFIRTKMGPHIKAEGWDPWQSKTNPNSDPGSVTRYSEFGSTDLDGKPLDVSKRVAWAKQLTVEDAAKYTAETVLAGEDQWKPAAKK